MSCVRRGRKRRDGHLQAAQPRAPPTRALSQAKGHGYTKTQGLGEGWLRHGFGHKLCSIRFTRVGHTEMKSSTVIWKLSAVFQDVGSTEAPELSSRKEGNSRKQPSTQQIYIKWQNPACSRPAPTAVRTLTASSFFSKRLEIFMKSRRCSESKREDNHVNVGGGCTESHPRPKPRQPAFSCSQQVETGDIWWIFIRNKRSRDALLQIPTICFRRFLR